MANDTGEPPGPAAAELRMHVDRTGWSRSAPLALLGQLNASKTAAENKDANQHIENSPRRRSARTDDALNQGSDQQNTNRQHVTVDDPKTQPPSDARGYKGAEDEVQRIRKYV